MQGFFNALLPGPAVQCFNFRLQRIQVGVLVGCKIKLNDVLGARQTCAGSYENSSVRVQAGFLRNVGNTQVLLQLQSAIVRLFKSRKYLQKRRLACAVAANQANALVGFKGKICMIQQSDVPKSELSVKKGNECHIESDYPVVGGRRRLPGKFAYAGNPTGSLVVQPLWLGNTPAKRDLPRSEPVYAQGAQKRCYDLWLCR